MTIHRPSKTSEWYEAQIQTLKNAIIGQDEMIKARDAKIKELRTGRQWLAFGFGIFMLIGGIIIGGWLF